MTGDLAAPEPTCMDLWEPDAIPQQTHSCGKRAGHALPHICPDCGAAWDRPRDRSAYWMLATAEWSQ